MRNIPKEDQCWFKSCTEEAVIRITYRDNAIDVCVRHGRQFHTSYEKQTPNGFSK